MAKRSLNQEQLQGLYAFCKRKDIRYLELRMELVDHIASRIEALWEEDEGLSFKEAFHRVYRSFGIFGLSEVAESQAKSVSKRFYWSAWYEFKSWLRPPKVFALVVLMSLLYFLLQSYPFLSLAVIQLNWLFALGALIILYLRKRKLKLALRGEESVLMGAFYEVATILYLVFLGPSHQFAHFNGEDYQSFTGVGVMIFALGLTLLNVLVNTVGFRFLRSLKLQLEVLKARQSFYFA
jgi:hypothetical protein